MKLKMLKLCGGHFPEWEAE